MTSAILLAIFAAWFVVSAACQLRVPAVRAVRRFDVLGLIPRWNFFAPRPIVGDLIVQYRAWEGGRPGPWSDFPVPGHRRLRDGLWPVHRRAKKAAFDAAAKVVRLYAAHAGEPSRIVTSVPYLLLLGRASAGVKGGGGEAVQFRILRITYGSGGPRPAAVFRSATHRV